jgi:hypothetical protein
MVISSVTVMPIIIQDATRVSHIMASHHDAWANEKICRTSFASVRYVSAEGGNGHIQRCESCARLGAPALGLALLLIMRWMHVYIKNFMVAVKKVPALPVACRLERS